MASKKQKLSPESARRYLSRVDQDWKAFWFKDGPIAHNLEEMQKSISRLKKATFQHHVNKKKNDIALWVQHVIGDTELAAKLKKSKTKKTIASALKSRVAALKKKAKAKAKKK